MYQTETLMQKVKLISIVMWPILITQLGLYSMNFMDTIMSGRVSASDLAGVAIGSSLWIPVLTGISGILMALTPIISQKIGANEKEHVSFYVVQGMSLSILISLAVFVIGYVILDPILALMTLEPEVSYIAKHYLIGLSAGIIPLFLYNTIRGFIDSLGQTRVSMTIMLLALPVNFVLNYVLIFGKFGFPKLGGIGAGYASALTYWFIFFVTVFIVHRIRPFKSYQVFSIFYGPNFKACKEILLLGLPIGLTIFFETSIFSAVTLLMSQFTTEIIAAHQAAINFASLLYMIPMSIAFTLTIVVGFEVGGKRLLDARAYTKIGILFSIIMGVFAGIIIYILRVPVSALYTVDPEVSRWIQYFLVYAVFFQLSDAINTPIQGVLRGYKDVNVPFIMALVSFWIIGLPLGFILANFTSLGPAGYWLGLIVGLAVCAIFLAFRLYKVQQLFDAKQSKMD